MYVCLYVCVYVHLYVPHYWQQRRSVVDFRFEWQEQAGRQAGAPGLGGRSDRSPQVEEALA